MKAFLKATAVFAVVVGIGALIAHEIPKIERSCR